MSVKISGVIISYNEEEYIERCIQSMLGIVDEIVIVDSYSTDGTKTICEKYDTVFIEKPFESFGEQKDFAVQQASYEYILSLDADEALSDTLKESILEVKSNWQKDAYWLKRRNFYCGKWLKHSGKYPDKKLRLFDRRKAGWVERLVHETVEAKNPQNTKILKGDLLHLEYYSYIKHADKINYYTTLSAQFYIQEGKRASLWKIFFRPSWAFFKSYFLQLGILDGKQGLIVCCFSAYSTFLKYIKLYGLQNGQTMEGK